MNAKNLFKLGVVGLYGMATLALSTLDISPAAAHGERSQEPFLRMRTIQWYDMKWGPDTTKVNDFATMTGKFHLAEDWPRAVGKPGRAFFNVGSPSPVFVRLSTKLNGEPTYISGPLEIGRDYAFEVKLKARIPGRHHMFLPRSRVLLAYGDELLLDPMDKKVAWIVLIATFGIVWGGYRYTETKHPYTVPIQAGESKVQPMPVKPNPIAIKVTHANYDVPGRALRVTMNITNSGDTAYRIGEFTTAGVRFINKVGLKHLDRNYPKELVATGLSMDNDAPIQPGETREVKMEAKDALWEVQRLMALLGDPESRFGGLLMTWSDAGDRNINSIAGAVIPVFTKL